MPDDNDDLTTESEQDSDLVRRLRKELKAKSKAPEVDVEAIKRENAFLKAGINPDDPKVKYFAKAYDGPLETDAILAEAKAAGFIAEPSTATAAEDDEREIALGNLDTMRTAAQARRSEAPAGGSPFSSDYEAAMRGLLAQPMTPENGTNAALAVMKQFGVKTTQDV